MGIGSSRPAVPAHASAAEIASHFNLSTHWTSAEPPAGAAAFSASNHTYTTELLQQGWRAHTRATNNAAWQRDPFDHGNSEAVLEISYPDDSRLGEQFSMSAPDRREGAQTALLQYEVAFDPLFDFVKGGKLPGLRIRSMRRRKHRDNCLSARLMWRQRGAGEVYAYIPTYAGFCEERSVACDRAYGTSIARGSFAFAQGGWTTVTQVVSLNTPGVADGLLYLWVNSSLALAHEEVLWRTNASVTLSNILFSTFFGGGDDSYNSKLGANSYFRRFEVYSSSRESDAPGRAVTAILGDPYPPSRRRAAAISASLIYFVCLIIATSPLLHYVTS